MEMSRTNVLTGQRYSTDKNEEFVEKDVYSGIETPYALRNNAVDAQAEFSLQSIQAKLGGFSGQLERNDSQQSPDLMPSQSTLNMSFVRRYEKEAAEAHVKSSSKTKLAVCCYVAAVLILVLAIALSSVAVSGAFAEMSLSSSSYAEIYGKLQNLEQQLSKEDYDFLVRRAAELGYGEAGTSNTYKEIDTRPAQNFGVESNWFDQLCDWLSGVFGG